MNLGDAFSRRKQIDSEIDTWTARLRLAGRETTQYQTKSVEGKEKFVHVPGTSRVFKRNYTITECKEKVQALLKEDRAMAVRISLTNQLAKARLVDLDGQEREYSIPELLVLKNEMAPKWEEFYRAIPLRSTGVEIMADEKDSIRWRTIVPVKKKEQSLSDKGHKIENDTIDYYSVEEVVDHGLPQREVYDRIDEVHSWMHRIKEAINQANKTELVEI